MMRNKLTKMVLAALCATALMAGTSKTAFAIDTIKDVNTNNTASVDVNAKVSGSKDTVYKVDVEWGAMQFVYSSDAVWNPDTHTSNGAAGWQTSDTYYGTNNEITVTNHSNSGVRIAYAYADQGNAAFTGKVDGNFFDTQEHAKAAATAGKGNAANVITQSTLATAVGTEVASAPKKSVFFSFSGAPGTGAPTDFTKVGTITLTVSQQP